MQWRELNENTAPILSCCKVHKNMHTSNLLTFSVRDSRIAQIWFDHGGLISGGFQLCIFS